MTFMARVPNLLYDPEDARGNWERRMSEWIGKQSLCFSRDRSISLSWARDFMIPPPGTSFTPSWSLGMPYAFGFFPPPEIEWNLYGAGEALEWR